MEEISSSETPLTVVKPRLFAFIAFIQVANFLKPRGTMKVELCRYQLRICTFQSKETRRRMESRYITMPMNSDLEVQ